MLGPVYRAFERVKTKRTKKKEGTLQTHAADGNPRVFFFFFFITLKPGVE